MDHWLLFTGHWFSHMMNDELQPSPAFFCKANE